MPGGAATLCDYAAAMDGHCLYILFRIASCDCRLFKTTNFDEWTEVKVASNVSNCVALQHHRRHLYCLSQMDVEPPFMELWKLEDETATTGAWKTVSNPCCLQDGLFTSMCSVGDNILLVGCRRLSKTHGTVLAYNTKVNEWMKQEAWPPMPVPIHDGQALLHNGELSVFCGTVQYERIKKEEPNSIVMSLPLDVPALSSSKWSKSCLPSPINTMSGVAQLHGHIIVAGGYHIATYRESNEVFALNPAWAFNEDARKWIPLPGMPTKRYCPQLLSNSRHIVAVGGVVGAYPRSVLSPAIEVLDVQL